MNKVKQFCSAYGGWMLLALPVIAIVLCLAASAAKPEPRTMAKPPAETEITFDMDANRAYTAEDGIGKLHLLDRDVPRDREQAIYWFTLSAAQGNEYAQFFLDHIDEFHDPSLLFSASRLLSSISKLFEDQQQKQTAQADHIDRKRMRELRQKMQAQGHAHDEHVQNQSY